MEERVLSGEAMINDVSLSKVFVHRHFLNISDRIR